MRIYPADPPPAETDAANPGTRMVGFEVRTAAGAQGRIVVHLAPQPAGGVAVAPLAEW